MKKCSKTLVELIFVICGSAFMVYAGNDDSIHCDEESRFIPDFRVMQEHTDLVRAHQPSVQSLVYESSDEEQTLITELIAIQVLDQVFSYDVESNVCIVSTYYCCCNTIDVLIDLPLATDGNCCCVITSFSQ